MDRENWERERRNNSHLLDELSKELEELRAYKFEKEREKNVFRTLSVSDLPLSRYDCLMIIVIGDGEYPHAWTKYSGDQKEVQFYHH